MKFLIAQRQLDAFHQDKVPMASLRVMYSVSYVSLRFVFEEALYVSFNTSCIAFPVIRTEHFRGKELVGSYVMRKSSQKSIWDAVGAAIIMTTNTKATCQSAYFTFCQFGTWSPIVVVEFDIPRYSSAHLLGHRHFGSNGSSPSIAFGRLSIVISGMLSDGCLGAINSIYPSFPVLLSPSS